MGNDSIQADTSSNFQKRIAPSNSSLGSRDSPDGQTKSPDTAQSSDLGPGNFELSLQEKPPEQLRNQPGKKKVRVLEVKSDQSYRVQVGESKLEVNGEVNLEKGDTFPARLTRKKKGWKLKHQPDVENQKFSKIFQKFTNSLDLANVDLAPGDALEILQQNPNAKAGEFIAKITGGNNPGAEASGASNRLFELLQLIAHNQEGSNRQPLELMKQLLEGQNELELLEQLFSNDSRPDRVLLEQLLDLELTDSDPADQSAGERLSALLFLESKGLSAESEKAQKFLPAFSQQTLGRKTADDVPRLDPGADELAKQLRNTIRDLGFDLENRLVDASEEALNTLRGRLTGVIDFPGRSEAEFEDAPENYADLLKHAAASATDPDKIFLFVPYSVDEKNAFFQMMIEDERESDGAPAEEHWSVTLEVDLTALGKIQAELLRDDEQLAVDFRAANPRALKILRTNQGGLCENLEELGYEVTVRAGRLPSEEEEIVEREIFNTTATETMRLDLKA